MLWCWESPADIRFLRPDQAGVAFLAASFLLDGDHVRVRLRRSRLRTSPGAFLMSVIRIETQLPVYSRDQRHQLVESITHVVKTTGIKAVQLDFDAPKSGRAFYRALIPELRAKLDPGMFLSVTALASWCESGDWLESLAVDEVVPMLFRMGPAGPSIRGCLLNRGQFPSPACRTSIGLDPTEPGVPALRKGYKRVYLFMDWRRWTPENLKRMLKELAQQ